ncbi:MAG: cupin-like domain-containing protein [Steroidobacteraceae bacterium]
MITPMPAPIPEHTGLDDAAVRQRIIEAQHPAVLRGFVSHWPAVQSGTGGADSLPQYLKRFDSGTSVDAILMPAEEEGRLAYNAAMDGFNFVRNRLPIAAVAEQILRYAKFERPPSVAVQSALISDCLPGFTAENRLTVLPDTVLPRIWLGNAITTPAHLDEWHNIGCVICGRRRFTLFPPEQVANLYIGPLDFAPTGVPMSLVQLHAPDLNRFPRFREAWAAAMSAELEAGDAIYIPPLWWHHVVSLDKMNALVNYWWHAQAGESAGGASSFLSLLHAVLSVRQLPSATRESWRALFEHYVFGPQHGVSDHMPPERRGVLGELSNEELARARAQALQRLK